MRTLAAPVTLDTDDQAMLEQTEGRFALAYLAARGSDQPGLVNAFELEVADPGAAAEDRIFRESGCFNAGQVVEVYGRPATMHTEALVHP